jgi:hypothetical protein
MGNKTLFGLPVLTLGGLHQKTNDNFIISEVKNAAFDKNVCDVT